MDDRVSCAIVYDYPGSRQGAVWPVGRLLVGLLSGPTDAVGISGNVGDRVLALGRVHSMKYGITSQRPAVVSQIMSVDRADVG